MALLRVQIYDIPYNGKYLLHDQQTLKKAGTSDRSKTVYIAFPDGAPFVYVSIATAPGQPAGGEGRNLRKIVLDVGGLLPISICSLFRETTTNVSSRHYQKQFQDLRLDIAISQPLSLPNRSHLYSPYVVLDVVTRQRAVGASSLTAVSNRPLWIDQSLPGPVNGNPQMTTLLMARVRVNRTKTRGS